MPTNLTLVIYGSALILGLGLAFATILMSRNFRRSSAELRNIDRRIGDLTAEVQPNLQDENRIVRFYVLLDNNVIMDLYGQILPEGGGPTSREIEEKTAAQRAAGLDLQQLTGSISKSRNATLRVTYGPETERVRALAAVEKVLVDAGKVQVLDLTAFRETKPVDMFIAQIKRKAESVGFTFPASVEPLIKEAWNRQRLAQRDEQVMQLRGFVRVRADFSIRSQGGNFVLESVTDEESATVKVSVICKHEHILPSGGAVFESGDDVRATCLGSVVRWNPEERILVVLPIGIYS